MIKAACLLHDVNWRAHPDYRAEVCFDTATRANLAGLSHKERIYLGLSLMHRYRNRTEGHRFENLVPLLSDADQREAEVLGRAMRFGAMLWITPDVNIGDKSWAPRKRLLTLKLSKETAPLFGEVAQARFASLTQSLEAESHVKGL